MIRQGDRFDVLAGISTLLVDEAVGIINRVEEVRPDPGAPAFFHYAGLACNTRAFSRQQNFGNSGGASANRERAVAKAIGEAVERYCSSLYDVEELALFASSDASARHVAPSEFALHSPEQYESPGFPWVPFEETTPVRWVLGRELPGGAETFVPAAMVYVPYTYYRGTGDSPIAQPISTGLACHSSETAAAIGAICEVVERDAFTLTWQAMQAPPQIRIETLNDEAYDLVQRFERTGDKVVLFSLPTDHGLPTILAVLRGQSVHRPALVFAAATAPTPAGAVRSALEELAHTRRYSQQITDRMKRLALVSDHANVVDQLDHLNVYCDHGNARLADFLFQSNARLDYEELRGLESATGEETLQRVVEAIGAIGHRIVLVNLTSPDVQELGLTVVRAVVPGFHPLFMGHRIRALGGTRLWEFPQRLGQRGIARWVDNPAPHPYP
ncbi:MAG TPA: YcaO-like family protein [Vicinamibacterales bacterium]|nr:YcaO-like family protein [Vicinamibacterales bacterium]